MTWFAHNKIVKHFMGSDIDLKCSWNYVVYDFKTDLKHDGSFLLFLVTNHALCVIIDPYMFWDCKCAKIHHLFYEWWINAVKVIVMLKNVICMKETSEVIMMTERPSLQGYWLDLLTTNHLFLWDRKPIFVDRCAHDICFTKCKNGDQNWNNCDIFDYVNSYFVITYC